MADRASFTATEKLEAVRRELGFRRTVYASHVRRGRMTQPEADFQIAVFEAIAADYDEMARPDRLL